MSEVKRYQALERENAECRDSSAVIKELIREAEQVHSLKSRLELAEEQNADLTARIASLEREKEEARGTCGWYPVNDDGDHWESECGASFILNDGTPTENEMHFCHRCGKPLQECLPEEEEKP